MDWPHLHKLHNKWYYTQFHPSSAPVAVYCTLSSTTAHEIASDAQIILYGDMVIVAPETQVGAGQQADPNLTSLSDVLGYSDNQIQ